ncbi:uncharacterized protein [Penaeus vannamei]|uniref:uncharacterized protein isoform X2 n=1 Tax=Penaeus vannamei TaxID=6689 RepID=UPI00387FB1CE
MAGTEVAICHSPLARRHRRWQQIYLGDSWVPAYNAAEPETMERVLELQGDGVASEWSWASPGVVSLGPAPLPALTLCLHLLLPAHKASSTLFSFATNATDNFITIDVKADNTAFSIGGIWSVAKPSLVPGSWVSVCLSYTAQDALWTYYTAGKERTSGTLRSSKRKTPPVEVAPSGWLVVGQDQDKFGGGFQADQSFRGQVARVRLWGRVLGAGEVAQVAECGGGAGDGLLPWLTGAWTLNHTARVIEIPRDEICRKKGPYRSVLSPALPYSTAEKQCSAIKANLATPGNREDSDRLRTLVQETDPSCYGGPNQPLLWLGATDEKQEGEWVDAKDAAMRFTAWAAGQPNGGRRENNAAMTGAGAWADVSSKVFSYCAVCDAADPLVLTVLGLCENLPHDHYYVQESHANTKPYFRGYTVSNISWLEDRWLAKHPDSKVLLSYTPILPYEYPFGRRGWVVEGAEGCGRPGDGSLALTLTTCSRGNFTCDDGSCLPMEMRCDSQADCPDESDENHCELMTIPESYRRHIPPRSSQNDAAYPVSLHVSVLALEIITDKMEIVMDFEVTLQWLDRRLVFSDLNEDSVINALRLDHLNRLWIPEVSFANAKGNAHTLIDGETDGSILRWGEPRSGDSTYSREVYFFTGAENPIQLKRKYSATYSCSLNLALYPFDTQVCSFDFVLTSARKEKLELVAAEQDLGVRYEGEWQLMEYTIEHFSMLDKNHSKYSQKEVVVRFRRRYGFAILTVYTPSTFFVCIAYLTTFFPVSNLQVRVIIALTAMLVLTTLLNQVSAQLPRNSYFKALDMWMFGAIGLIFSILILQTVVDVVHRKAQENVTKVVPASEKNVVQFVSENPNTEQRAVRMLKYMQIIFPLLMGVLVLIYSIYLISAVK